MPDDRDTQFDLLTAALLGAAVGAGLAVLAGAGRRRTPTLSGAMLAALKAGSRTRVVERATSAGRKAARRGVAAARGFAEDTGDTVRDYASSAREAIDEAVEREVRDLRRAIRRRRKKLGL